MKIWAIAALALSCGSLTAQQQQPNVLIILSDDQGWGDVGFNGCTDIPTPNLDQLAKSGVSFSAGYASHPYCSPSRAGLLSGRYQQHFGHESNIQEGVERVNDGLPLDQLMLSEILHQHGYKTCAIGKWHLGDSKQFWPTSRGFDDWFGFTAGGRNYSGIKGNEDPSKRIMHNDVAVAEEELTYLTDDFTREAVRYIGEYANDEKPFFMYLAYNAPHTPNQATKKYLKKMEHQEDGMRAVYGAMVAGMDEGIGWVIQKLKETGQYDNTLIFFYSDNGGAVNGASCKPYRGHKGMVFEGGIRIPFLISWPAGLKGGTRNDIPVIALDIYPTVLAAAGIDYPVQGRLDGLNLFPFLQPDKKADFPDRALYWRTSEGLSYAVRQGDYKLVKSGFKDKSFLYNLASDPYEMNDLSKEMPEKFAEMKQLYDEWDQKNVPMKWTDPHPENVKKEEQHRQSFIKAACAGESK